MTSPSSGRFTWHELMTPDPKAAMDFYGKLLGWTVEEMNMGPAGTYRIVKQGDKGVGGCMLAEGGMPTAWLTYVGTDDVEATVKQIVEHHGKVIVPPTEVPGMVRFALALDPQGAAFGVLKGLGPNADDPMPEGPQGPGTFCWDELHTSDQKAAGAFYGAVFGWTGHVGPDDPMKYWHWSNRGKEIGGMMTLQAPGVPPNWLAYLAVADVDASTKAAQELGGKLLMPVMDIPKVGKFAVLQDPTGATFALFRSGRE